MTTVCKKVQSALSALAITILAAAPHSSLAAVDTQHVGEHTTLSLQAKAQQIRDFRKKAREAWEQNKTCQAVKHLRFSHTIEQDGIARIRQHKALSGTYPEGAARFLATANAVSTFGQASEFSVIAQQC